VGDWLSTLVENSSDEVRCVSDGYSINIMIGPICIVIAVLRDTTVKSDYDILYSLSNLKCPRSYLLSASRGTR